MIFAGTAPHRRLKLQNASVTRSASGLSQIKMMSTSLCLPTTRASTRAGSHISAGRNHEAVNPEKQMGTKVMSHGRS